MIKIAVASQNPVKVKAVKEAFALLLPHEEIEVSEHSVASGVPDQPMTDQETYLGAYNRVENVSKLVLDMDYWVAIEGGLEDTQDDMYALAWSLIKAKGITDIGKGKSGYFVIPNPIATLIRSGLELGDASDQVYKLHNIKQHNGTVGMLTDNLIDRTAYYVHPLILAFARFKHPELFS